MKHRYLPTILYTMIISDFHRIFYVCTILQCVEPLIYLKYSRNTNIIKRNFSSFNLDIIG